MAIPDKNTYRSSIEICGLASEHQTIGDLTSFQAYMLELKKSQRSEGKYQLLLATTEHLALNPAKLNSNDIILFLEKNGDLTASRLSTDGTGIENVLLDLSDEDRKAILAHLPSTQAAAPFVRVDKIDRNLHDAVLFQSDPTPYIDSLAQVDPQKLILENKLCLAYSDIVALMGDFYGVVGHPVSSEMTEDAQTYRFIEAFETLSASESAREEAPLLLAEIAKEKPLVDKFVQDGKEPSEAHAAMNKHYYHDRCFSWITSKNWREHIFLNSRYVQLAKENNDHFVPNAHRVYMIGHQLALQTAGNARAMLCGLLETEGASAYQNRELMQPIQAELTKALALEAAADHFGTDAFFAGHLLSPRNDLKPFEAKAQHDQDGKNGIEVEGLVEGEIKRWRAVGDGYLLDNNDGARITQKAASQFVEKGREEVVKAFMTGHKHTSEMLSFFPRVVNDPTRHPLYRCNEEKDIVEKYNKKTKQYEYLRPMQVR